MTIRTTALAIKEFEDVRKDTTTETGKYNIIISAKDENGDNVELEMSEETFDSMRKLINRKHKNLDWA